MPKFTGKALIEFTVGADSLGWAKHYFKERMSPTGRVQINVIVEPEFKEIKEDG